MWIAVLIVSDSASSNRDPHWHRTKGSEFRDDLIALPDLGRLGGVGARQHDVTRL
jgi:hypothetical protein